MQLESLYAYPTVQYALRSAKEYGLLSQTLRLFGNVGVRNEGLTPQNLLPGWQLAEGEPGCRGWSRLWQLVFNLIY